MTPERIFLHDSRIPLLERTWERFATVSYDVSDFENGGSIDVKALKSHRAYQRLCNEIYPPRRPVLFHHVEKYLPISAQTIGEWAAYEEVI